MTQPVQEPSHDRSVSGLEFRTRQLFRRPRAAAGTNLPFTLGELGYSGSGTLAATYTHTIDFLDVQPGDLILVAALAPSKPSALATPGIPTSCEDSKGNIYGAFDIHYWEAAAPVVNEGFVLGVFYCDTNVDTLVDGTDWIKVTWNNDVYDRSIMAWIVRYPSGGPSVDFLAASADNDAAIYASTQVVLQSPAFTPTRSSTLELAMVVSAKTGGLGGFGGVGGYSGFYQAKFHTFAGSKQSYLFNCQTHGADAYIVANSGVVTPYEIDLGALPGGVLVPAFNGVGQLFTLGANAWKGIELLQIN